MNSARNTAHLGRRELLIEVEAVAAVPGKINVAGSAEAKHRLAAGEFPCAAVGD